MHYVGNYVGSYVGNKGPDQQCSRDISDLLNSNTADGDKG